MTVPGAALVGFYVLLVCAPAGLAAWLGPSGGGFLLQAGRSAALVGFAILVLQGVLAARWKWVTRHFGLDVVLRFHRRMALLAGGLILAHPILLSAGGSEMLGDSVPWPVWLGTGVLVLVGAQLVAGIYRKRLGVSFERWRVGHDLLAVALVGGALVHAWFLGADLAATAMRAVWIGLAAVAAAAFAWHRFVGPALRRRRPWKVTAVEPEANGVWTVELEPPEGQDAYDVLPGQFHFITLFRERGLPEEEHHFTISSSPTRPGRVASAIKESGDFTATIGQTKVGDTAGVQGPFGRFSYRLHPDERDLVFIAGGIGITPLMSMLRAMHDRQEDRRVLLLYGNRTAEDIAFRGELDDIAGGEAPDLNVVHVLSHAADDWTGRTGYVDRGVLDEFLGGGVDGKTFYVCGPGPMLEMTVQNLKDMGARDRQIRTEIFSLVG